MVARGGEVRLCAGWPLYVGQSGSEAAPSRGRWSSRDGSHLSGRGAIG